MNQQLKTLRTSKKESINTLKTQKTALKEQIQNTHKKNKDLKINPNLPKYQNNEKEIQ